METARNKIFSKPEAADFLKVSAVTVDRQRKKGILPYHQIGDRVIFTEKDLEIFLKNCEAPRVSRVKK
ncbi:MAG: helix-turn-helix domain-containing protein [Treponema sp.]|nr:helix-turn-helix domain-containing protein [Treponema sp.]